MDKIIIDDQRVAAVVAEVLGHRCRGIRRQELHRCRVRRGRGNNDGIFHRAGFFELLNQLRNCGTLLTDRNVDAVQLLALVVASGVVVGLLVQDRVERDSCFTGLTVTNDQLALATANGIIASTDFRPVAIGS